MTLFGGVGPEATCQPVPHHMLFIFIFIFYNELLSVEVTPHVRHYTQAALHSNVSLYLLLVSLYTGFKA